jgi:hypothetical protein
LWKCTPLCGMAQAGILRARELVLRRRNVELQNPRLDIEYDALHQRIFNPPVAPEAEEHELEPVGPEPVVPPRPRQPRRAP